ncbi:aspartyl-phosphate phosphatase Spo0E family protein [Effusibacillus pohliae]|uniref:aspartyl-phosphate phosphatase Spo0E family protein n=1 Tax=Effusibacillus pohliae TaxID=232270 RepID=UPI00036FE863|nr:aspartyl-phosphate phosphatase Spo0E family protein [Effusibacillus pohliae]
MNEATLEEKVETIRRRMIELAEKKGNLADKSVVAISQQLDKYLVFLQRSRMNVLQKTS